MGRARNQRARGEATFLELVKIQMQHLQADICTIKAILLDSSHQLNPVVLPPVPPPPYSYDRDTLLALRSPAHRLPTIVREHDEITDFLHSQGHFDEEPSCAMEGCKIEEEKFDISARIEIAQKAAEFREDTLISASRFPSAMRSKRRQRGGSVERGSALAADRNDSSEPSPPAEAALGGDGFFEQVCADENKVADGDRNGESHRLKIKEFMELMKPSFELSAERMQAEGWTPLDSANFLCHKALIMAKQRHLDENIAMGFRNEVLEMTRVSRDQLKLTVGRDPHFICQDCAFVTEVKSRFCMVCNGSDIFDARQCVCGNSGICGIGDCKSDWSQSESD